MLRLADPPRGPPLDRVLWRVKSGHHRGKIVDQAELDRLRGLRYGDSLIYERAAIRECDCCGRRDAWQDGWGWYGSLNDIDDGKPVRVWCSDDCRRRLRLAGLLPKRMAKLDA